MTNSREKGAAGEREFARLCLDQGYQCRRGQQFSGIEGEDVVGLPGIHIECKRVEKLNIEEAMVQSRRDAKEGEMPIVVFRRNRENWKICMDAKEWFAIYREWEASQDLKRRNKDVPMP
jgi:Holliday junction resolvase